MAAAVSEGDGERERDERQRIRRTGRRREEVQGSTWSEGRKKNEQRCRREAEDAARGGGEIGGKLREAIG